MKKVLSVLFVFLVLSVLTGCSPNLSRNSAKPILAKYFASKSVVTYLPSMWSMIDTQDQKNYAKSLVKDGLLKTKVMFFMEHYEFTDKGKPYLLSEADGPYFTIKIGDYDIMDVTGIALNSTSKEATVDFTYKIKNPTPFAKGLKYLNGMFGDDKNLVVGDKATMILYDDGWRVKEAQE